MCLNPYIAKKSITFGKVPLHKLETLHIILWGLIQSLSQKYIINQNKKENLREALKPKA